MRGPRPPGRTARPPRDGGEVGFTLIEMVVVVTILAAAILLVPMNLTSFGSRTRLENAANTLVAVVGASRSQAIFDGFSVHLEVGIFKDENGKPRHGHRWVITNQPVERSEELLQDDAYAAEAERERPAEREWIELPWTELPRGVVFAGVSEREGQWQTLREERPYRVTFAPDGSVEKGFALRIRSEDLETREADRTVTVLVNGLTVEAQAMDGEAEMPPQREENEFGK